MKIILSLVLLGVMSTSPLAAALDGTCPPSSKPILKKKRKPVKKLPSIIKKKPKVYASIGADSIGGDLKSAGLIGWKERDFAVEVKLGVEVSGIDILHRGEIEGTKGAFSFGVGNRYYRNGSGVSANIGVDYKYLVLRVSTYNRDKETSGQACYQEIAASVNNKYGHNHHEDHDHDYVDSDRNTDGSNDDSDSIRNNDGTRLEDVGSTNQGSNNCVTHRGSRRTLDSVLYVGVAIPFN